MTSKTKIIIGSAVGGVVLLGGIGTLAQGNSDSSTSYPDDYIYTIDELCSRADTERNFGNKHSDEIFTISGTIDRTSYKSVYFESNVDKSSYSKYQLECEFDDQDTVKTLSENDTVTISGKLYHLILSEVTLKDCTLISVENSNNTSEDIPSTSPSSEEDTSNTGNQSTESGAQNSSIGFESSSDISKPESSDRESSNSSSSESIVESQQPSTESVPQTTATPPATESPKADVVYIAATGNGIKYHRDPNCSKMNGDVIEMTRDEAEAAGYSPCQKNSCYGSHF